MSYQQRHLHRLSIASTGLVLGSFALLPCIRYLGLLIRSSAVTLVQYGEKRGRQQVLDEVQTVAHGHLQAHIFALQHVLHVAERATASDTGPLIREAQSQAHMLRRQVEDLYTEPSNSISNSSFEQSLQDVTTSLSGAYPECAHNVLVFGHATTTLSSALQHALLVVLYNALHNAHVHGNATSVRVQLHYAPDAVILVISDDGVGLDAQNPPKKGRGLRDMQHVVQRQSGELLVEGKVGGGTCVVATLPIPDPTSVTRRTVL